MRGAWRVARLAGVDFYVHWSVSLVILWLGWQGASGSLKVERLNFMVVVVMALFGCMVLHEVGHAWMAHRLNVTVRSVTLLPFGGYVEMHAVAQPPLHELLISLGGPLINLLLTLGLAGLLAGLDGLLLLDLLTTPHLVIDGLFLRAAALQTPVVSLLLFLIFANAILFAFNLIPVLPLDGGRVLRALLALWLPYRRATQLALIFGQLFAIMLVVSALAWRSFGLLLWAIFVLIAGLPVLRNHRRLSRIGSGAGRDLGDR